MNARFFSWVVFSNFLLIDATDRSMISSDQKRLFFAVSLYLKNCTIICTIAIAQLIALNTFLKFTQSNRTNTCFVFESDDSPVITNI